MPRATGLFQNGWEEWPRAAYPRWRECCSSRTGGGGEDPLGFQGSVGILVWAGRQGQRFVD